MTWHFIIGMIVGAWIGCLLGIFIVGLCIAASDK